MANRIIDICEILMTIKDNYWAVNGISYNEDEHLSVRLSRTPTKFATDVEELKSKFPIIADIRMYGQHEIFIQF